jgi:phosphatidylserine decarboxylase
MAMQIPTDSVAPAVKWRFPAIHPEGRKFVVIAGAIAIMALLFMPAWIAWPLIGLTLWVAMFFRDPVRTVPLDDALIIAPADGLITLIQPVVPPRELAGEGGLGEAPLMRISIFMSVFDVHIQRAPVGGTVRRVVYIAGKFLNADLDKASEDNERQHFLIERKDGLLIGFTQIAGLVARRIMAFARSGDLLAVGQRIGLIRFGSRVDIYLPSGAAPRVVAGQRTIAGETVLAVIGDGTVTHGVAQ